MTGIKILGSARASLFMNLLPIFVAVVAAGRWPVFGGANTRSVKHDPSCNATRGEPVWEFWVMY